MKTTKWIGITLLTVTTIIVITDMTHVEALAPTSSLQVNSKQMVEFIRRLLYAEDWDEFYRGVDRCTEDQLGLTVPMLIKTINELKRDTMYRYGIYVDTMKRTIFILGRCGSKAQEAIPLFLDVLEHKDSYGVKEWAARALGNIGVSSEREIRILAKTITESLMRHGANWEVYESAQYLRAASADTLGRLGVGAHGALEALEEMAEYDVFQKDSALRALNQIRSRGGKVERYSIPIEQLFGDMKKAFVQYLTTPETNRATVGRRITENLVSKVRQMNQLSIPLLMGFLDHTDFRIRWCTTLILGGLEPQSKEIAPELVNVLLHDAHWLVRSNAAEVLGNINSPNATVPGIVTALLNDSSKYVQESAENALATIGIASSSELIKVLEQHQIEKSTQTAISLLTKMGEQVVPYLIKAWKGENKRDEIDDKIFRANVLTVFKEIGSAASSALPLVLEAIRNGEKQGSLLSEAISTLKKIVIPTQVPSLIERLADEQEHSYVISEVRRMMTQRVYALFWQSELSREACRVVQEQYIKELTNLAKNRGLEVKIRGTAVLIVGDILKIDRDDYHYSSNNIDEELRRMIKDGMAQISEDMTEIGSREMQLFDKIDHFASLEYGGVITLGKMASMVEKIAEDGLVIIEERRRDEETRRDRTSEPLPLRVMARDATEMQRPVAITAPHFTSQVPSQGDGTVSDQERRWVEALLREIAEMDRQIDNVLGEETIEENL